MTPKKGSIGLILFFYLLGMFLISFDTFLVIPAGVNIRASQILLLIPILVFFLNFLLKPNLHLPIGFLPLILWAAFIFIFIPNTAYFSRSIGYFFWLIFNILLILSTVYFFGKSDKIFTLLKFYLWSFSLISLFGIIQFVLPFFKIQPPLVTQWWVPGLIPRVNGFSYEPSYFATYLLLGWCLSAFLLREKSRFIKRSVLIFIFSTITLGIILSSSRMGLLLMGIWFLQYPVSTFSSLIKGRFQKENLVPSFLTILMLFGISSSLFLIRDSQFLNTFSAGLGVLGGTGHSSEQRFQEFSDTIDVFYQSPIVGYSLGGVSSAIASSRGVTLDSFEAAKENEGMSVFAEVLAASGIFGFLLFIIYLFLILINPLRLAQSLPNKEIKDLLRAFVFSLIFEIIILQFNQNILRPYLWLHIAILSALFLYGKIVLGKYGGTNHRSPDV